MPKKKGRNNNAASNAHQPQAAAAVAPPASAAITPSPSSSSSFASSSSSSSSAASTSSSVSHHEFPSALARKETAASSATTNGSASVSSDDECLGRWQFGNAPGVQLSHNQYDVPYAYLPGNFASENRALRTAAENKQSLVYKSAMNIATAPGKQLFMTAFMLWMAGSGLHIFSLIMVAVSLWQPIQKLLSVNETFAKYSNSSADETGGGGGGSGGGSGSGAGGGGSGGSGRVSMLYPKFVFISFNLLAIGLVLYKCETLGLLPTSAIDWLPEIRVRAPAEWSVGGMI